MAKDLANIIINYAYRYDLKSLYLDIRENNYNPDLFEDVILPQIYSKIICKDRYRYTCIEILLSNDNFIIANPRIDNLKSTTIIDPRLIIDTELDNYVPGNIILNPSFIDIYNKCDKHDLKISFKYFNGSLIRPIEFYMCISWKHWSKEVNQHKTNESNKRK